MNLTLTVFRSCFGLVIYFLLVVSVGVKAQPKADSAVRTVQQLVPFNSLFNTDTILEITLKGSIKELLNDRTDKTVSHALSIVYTTSDGKEVSIPVEAKTRGHFRKLKENCNYPPILLQFTKGEIQQASFFNEQVKMKLVMPCLSDEYVVREWLVYKLYNLVAPESFKARLIKLRLEDNNGKKLGAPFFGILLEEEKQLAKRNGMLPVTRKLKREQILPESFMKMTVFEYLIGNTDWSVEYLQNIKLMAADSLAVPVAVPYDFDHTGIVNAPYAKPAEELMMYSVRERRYRGYCITDMKDFEESFALFNKIKKEVYEVYTKCTLLDEKYKTATIKYLDEFYSTINNVDAVKKEFGYPCKKNGTGNVVIKGLKDDR